MKDILIDDENDLMIDGDFVIGDSTLQNQKILIMAEKGTIRAHGDSGVGAVSFLLDQDNSGFLRETSKEFVRDGMVIEEVSLDNDGKIITSAKYES